MEGRGLGESDLLPIFVVIVFVFKGRSKNFQKMV